MRWKGFGLARGWRGSGCTKSVSGRAMVSDYSCSGMSHTGTGLVSDGPRRAMGYFFILFQVWSGLPSSSIYYACRRRKESFNHSFQILLALLSGVTFIAIKCTTVLTHCTHGRVTHNNGVSTRTTYCTF